jgi:uncharacterized membrane protein YhaH (DUF805 family)
MNWYLAVLKKYAVFSGRAHRTEYWMFTLVNLIISLILVAVENLIGLVPEGGGQGVLSGIYTVAVLLPSLAVGVRRLHDTGRSGWWLLIGLAPLIGVIVLVVFFVQDSQPGSNTYGPNPKGVEAVQEHAAIEP